MCRSHSLSPLPPSPSIARFCSCWFWLWYYWRKYAPHLEYETHTHIYNSQRLDGPEAMLVVAHFLLFNNGDTQQKDKVSSLLEKISLANKKHTMACQVNQHKRQIFSFICIFSHIFHINLLAVKPFYRNVKTKNAKRLLLYIWDMLFVDCNLKICWKFCFTIENRLEKVEDIGCSNKLSLFFLR